MESRSLLLVRHGQASFGKTDYDNLSERGHEQAYLLGKSLAQRGITPDRVFCGGMKRHRQTLAEIAAGAGWQLVDDPMPAAVAEKTPQTSAPPKGSQTGTNQTAPTNTIDVSTPSFVDVLASHRPRVIPREVDDRWNELDHTAMLTAYKPAYKNMLLLKADMVRTLRPRIAFEDTFEKAVDRWTSREHDDDYPETFAEFTGRIETAVADVTARTEQTTLVVTSAGPVCWTTARLSAGGNLDAWKHFTLAAINTGVTRITIDRHGPRVLTFNEHSHLDAAGIITNR